MSTANSHTDGSGARSAGNATRAENIPAIERASGRDWSEWIRIFEDADARTLGHAAIARLAAEHMPESLENPFWWAQAAAIAYEQQVGLRVPGQSSSGDFRVSANRTLHLDRDTAIDAWVATHGSTPAHLGHAAGEPRPSRTEKRSFWRFPLENAGRVEISATPSGEGKCIVSVSHQGLPDGERIEEWRAYWKALLAEL